MPPLIEPRTLRGFRDYLPAQMIPRERMLETARQVYRSYGFAPIDTPALEYSEILLGKGGAESDRLIYRFKDHGDRDVALRFDLTVPFARFAAQYIQQLGTPFKRYHLGPVWRGENNAHGRYREFWQCDFDTIGTTSNAADAETVLVIHDLMRALGFERFTIRINNRMVLNGVLDELGLGAQGPAVLRALDKLPKIGAEAVSAEMVEQARIGQDHAQRILDLALTEGSHEEVLKHIENRFGGSAKASQGIGQLRELLHIVFKAGVAAERVHLDLAIARGLDYYTGTIYETFLDDKADIGSVCSGGRYDNLARLFTKQELPGVGASLGLDRLLAAMEDLDLLPHASTPAPVFVVQFDAGRVGEYQAMARALRKAGVGVEVFTEPKKIGQQLQFAEKRGYRVALIAGADEFEQGVWKVKHLASRTESTVVEAEVLGAVQKLLAAN